MTPQTIEEAASALRGAAGSGKFIRPLRETYPGIDIEAAYAIQQRNAALRVAEGRRIVGRKIGLTSLAVQRQLGVEQPDFGALFDDMGYGDGETVPLFVLSQPKIEAEVAFVMGRDLTAERPSPLEVLMAVDHVLPALEIVGSRIANWDIGIADTVADNASSCAFVVGTRPRRPKDLDLHLCGMVLERRGDPVSVGAGAACLGNPLNAVVWLARTLSARGTPLRAGDLVLSGALGPMVGVLPGDAFEARINGVGSVRIHFEPDRQGAER